MTALASGPDDLPWAQNGYLLFNSVRTGNLLQRLYQWNPGIKCEPLFCGTEFKALLAVSPVLVAIENEDDPVLQPFLESAHESWGLLLFAKAGMRAVADHLRWLVCVDGEVGNGTLLNLSDPCVANALFELHPQHTDSALFGPIDHVYAVDRFAHCWRHHQRIGDPGQNDHQIHYRVNAAQIEALNEVSFRNVVIKIDLHMRRHFPDFQRQLEPKQRFAYFLRLAQDAYRRGFHCESDLLHFANVSQFLQSEPPDAHPDIIELLQPQRPLHYPCINQCMLQWSIKHCAQLQ